ncbi:class IV adenylate cyclase [Advenella sp. FME57]|uniref:class IV adenylate cyclase n=1 Tax=Advenella sp. FME57 TaxID=2742604 RepID=UPI0018671FE1|nr:class IV adenylate cyclase [Advenella sp. FME57]
MARNIEIKARIASISDLAQQAATIATEAPCEIFQDDTFFKCDEGRLKLREFADGTGQLIFYRRPDAAGPKESFYMLSETATPESLREVLSLAYSVIGRVIKRRTLYMVGRTRVHLDHVQGLGQFMELEVVLEAGESTARGMQQAESLMQQLGIRSSQLIEGSYFDLLARRTPL